MLPDIVFGIVLLVIGLAVMVSALIPSYNKTIPSLVIKIIISLILVLLAMGFLIEHSLKEGAHKAFPAKKRQQE